MSKEQEISELWLKTERRVSIQRNTEKKRLHVGFVSNETVHVCRSMMF